MAQAPKAALLLVSFSIYYIVNTAASITEAAVLLCFVDAVMMECAHYGGFLTVGADADLPYTAELFNLNRRVSRHPLFVANPRKMRYNAFKTTYTMKASK